MVKLKLILKSQRFRLAFSTLIFFVTLAQFMRSGSLWWGVAYVLVAFFLYMRPIFNSSAVLPLFFGVLVMPFFFPPNLGIIAAGLFSIALTFLFFATLGIKNLILINRAAWREGSAYFFSYIVFLLFFMQAVSAHFWIIWLWAALSVFLALCLLMRDYRRALPCTAFMGELIWVASWLPIGFLGLANLCFAFLLFMGDAMAENRISIRKMVIFIVLIFVIFASSYL